MATFYSNLYVLSQDGRNYIPGAPTVARPGDPVWLRATVAVPATGEIGDVCKIAPIGGGLRPVGGILATSATNASLTFDVGYTSDPDGIVNDSTIPAAAANAAALTVAQLLAATVSVDGDELICTLGGAAVTNACTLTFLVQLANVGS